MIQKLSPWHYLTETEIICETLCNTIESEKQLIHFIVWSKAIITQNGMPYPLMM